ncbi:MAG: DUF1801 domain-containing protein [Dermatophilaceae bacterium]
MGTVEDYLATVEPSRRAALARVVDRARALIPEVTEGTSYAMPALMYRDKPLLAAISAKDHLAIYPFSGSVISAVAADLAGFALSKGTIRFQVDAPVPDDVLARIVLARRAEIDAKAPRSRKG